MVLGGGSSRYFFFMHSCDLIPLSVCLAVVSISVSLKKIVQVSLFCCVETVCDFGLQPPAARAASATGSVSGKV